MAELSTHRVQQVNYAEKIDFPVRAGAAAGFAGALAIMVVIGTMLILGGLDVFAAARLIASVLLGSAAETGLIPVILGTLIHLVTGTTLGVLFARVMPQMYRTAWAAVGLAYGFGTWVLTYSLILAPLFPLASTAESGYALLFAHAIYGVILGLAAAVYGMWWRLPERNA